MWWQGIQYSSCSTNTNVMSIFVFVLKIIRVARVKHHKNKLIESRDRRTENENKIRVEKCWFHEMKMHFWCCEDMQVIATHQLLRQSNAKRIKITRLTFFLDTNFICYSYLHRNFQLLWPCQWFNENQVAVMRNYYRDVKSKK